MKKVTSFSLGRLNNAYHINFHSNALAMVEQYGADSLGLSNSVVNAYKAEVNKEQDAVKRSQASAETAVIREADIKRDSLFRYIRNVLANLQYSCDADTLAIYEVAKSKILNIYPSTIPDESVNEESAHIRGFVLDIRQFLQNNIASLGISAALTALENANNTLQEQYIARAASLAAYGTEFTSKCRSAVDEGYAKIVARVEYTGQLTELTDESSVLIRQTCESFIDALNVLIARTWQSINQGKSLAGGSEEPEENPEDPQPEE